MTTGRSTAGDDPAAVVAVVLAAGRSARMGRPKLDLPWGTTTILGQVLATLRAAGIADIVVVARRGDDAAEGRAAEVGAALAEVDASGDGGDGGDGGPPTRSLQAAIALVRERQGDNADRALLVMPGDMPLVRPSTVAALVAAHAAAADGGGGIFAPRHAGRRGHPVIFGARLVARLAALEAHRPPRTVIEAHRDQLTLLPVDDAGVTVDIDDDASYRRWRPRDGSARASAAP